MFPAQWGGEGQESGIRVLSGSLEVVDGFVHVERVPEDDGGDHEVEGHDAFFLAGAGAVMDASLGMGKHGAGQGVAGFGLVQSSMKSVRSIRPISPRAR